MFDFQRTNRLINIILSVGFTRTKPLLRGGYYLHIEPGGSFVGGGFWEPNAADLQRIRKEFEMDDAEIRAIIADATFKNTLVS